MTVGELKVGDTVVFETVAPGSYAKTGELYRVTAVSKRDVRFTSQRGSSTYDSKAMLRMASFYQATC